MSSKYVEKQVQGTETGGNIPILQKMVEAMVDARLQEMVERAVDEKLQKGAK